MLKEGSSETIPEDMLHAVTMDHTDAYLPKCVAYMRVETEEEAPEDVQTLADPLLWENLGSLAQLDMITTARCASTTTTYAPAAFVSLMMKSTRE